ncbi:hypothetical protein L2D00_14460 [Hyphomonadaceae bacterium BL14]|nr:hypothetical protein L2D00_14460 [Hyphomonadaceae bacterium BL14]
MTIYEDSREKVTCLICDADDYWNCGHLVASFDQSFCDCYGGEAHDHLSDFSSTIEEAFLTHLRNGGEPSFNNATIDALWEGARRNSEPDEDFVDLDGYIFQRLLIELLEGAGAQQPPGSLIDPGGPGMTSSMSLLFAEEPPKVVAVALQGLSDELSLSSGEGLI